MVGSGGVDRLVNYRTKKFSDSGIALDWLKNLRVHGANLAIMKDAEGSTTLRGVQTKI